MRRWISKLTERWRPYAELVGALWTAGRFLTIGLAGTVIAGAVAPVGFVLAAATVVGHVPATVREGLGSHTGHVLLIGLGLMAFAFLVQQITFPLQQSVGYALGNRFNTTLEQRLMRATLRPPGIGHLEDPQLQNEILAATRGLSGWPRPADAATSLAARSSARISFTGATVLLGLFHWWVAVIIGVCGLWLMDQITKALYASAQMQIGQAAAQRRSVYLRELALTPPAAKEIRVFGLGRWLVERFRESYGSALAAMREDRARSGRPLRIASLVMSAVVAGTFLLLGWEAGGGHVSIARIAVAVQALMAVVRPLSENNSARDGLILAFALRSLATATKAERLLEPVPTALSGTRPADGMPAGALTFEGVSFRYPGQDRDVLHDLRLSVPAGRSLAIVGVNGAGKTTLMKLLCRLYEPTEGRITVDGVDLRDIDPTAWQRRIAAIFQDYVKYPLSAADNVTVGGPQRRHDEALLEEVARKAHLANLVENLPAGWQTTLSREFEGGVDLSGGEWQRVALARALFAAGAGASVLILDEPTASLDVRAEAEIYDQFLALTEGLTTLLISHRFSTVRRAERICVLEDGRIVEEGDHASLLSASGRYAELFRMQASRFEGRESEQAEVG